MYGKTSLPSICLIRLLCNIHGCRTVQCCIIVWIRIRICGRSRFWNGPCAKTSDESGKKIEKEKIFENKSAIFIVLSNFVLTFRCCIHICLNCLGIGGLWNISLIGKCCSSLCWLYSVPGRCGYILSRLITGNLYLYGTVVIWIVLRYIHAHNKNKNNKNWNPDLPPPFSPYIDQREYKDINMFFFCLKAKSLLILKKKIINQKQNWIVKIKTKQTKKLKQQQKNLTRP